MLSKEWGYKYEKSPKRSKLENLQNQIQQTLGDIPKQMGSYSEF